MSDVRVVEVFKSTQGGGNPAPIVIDAKRLDAEQMTAIARNYGHESGFVFPPQASQNNDYQFRFFVPLHETSRVKTLIPVRSPERLDAARPDSARIEALCEQLDSIGLYLFCPHPGVDRRFDSRQFPKASGYPEDAATGIAATALAFGLLEYGLIEASDKPILIHQGRAMGRPSDIYVRFDFSNGPEPSGYFVGGYSAFAEQQQPSGADHAE